MTSDTLLNSHDAGELIAEREGSVIEPEKQFIQLALKTETPILLSVLNLVEILTIPVNQIVPIFQLPAWVMGVYNWRGDILWMVDLNHLMGLSPWYQQKNYPSKHTVIVLKPQAKQNLPEVGEPMVGLVVNQVDDMVICEPELIQAIADLKLPETIQSFLEGCWTGEDGKAYWILAGEAILQAMPNAN